MRPMEDSPLRLFTAPMKPRCFIQRFRRNWLVLRITVELKAAKGIEEEKISFDGKLHVLAEEYLEKLLFMVIWTLLGFFHLQ